jgi:HEAT repeat protein
MSPNVARDPREQQREQAEVQTAVNTLKSRDEVVYLNGITTLQGMGSAVVPPLLELLRVGDGRVRAGAASALSPERRRRDPALTEQTVAALSQALDDAMPRVRHQAAQSLMGFGPQARAAVPPLTKLLGDENEDVRAMAARALAAIGPDAAAAVPVLLKALHEPSPAQSWARHALERIGTEQARQGLADFDRTADPRKH